MITEAEKEERERIELREKREKEFMEYQKQRENMSATRFIRNPEIWKDGKVPECLKEKEDENRT